MLLSLALLVCVACWQPKDAWSFPNSSLTSRGRFIGGIDRPLGTMMPHDQETTSKKGAQQEDLEHHTVYNDDRRNFLKQSTSFGAGAGAAASLFAGGLFPVAQTSTQPANAADEPSSSRKKKNLRDVKVALWGFGNQNKLMARYLQERKVPIVAVISHHDIGRDYTEVDLGVWSKKLGGRRAGVKIVAETDAKKTLLATQPDVCIMCTRSTLPDLQPSLTVCAESNVNVVTIAEEVLNSRKLYPALTNDMDALFRQHGVTLTGTGFEDGAVCEMVMTMSSMMHHIDAIQGSGQYNLNDYGPVLAEEHGVGLTPAQFQKEFAENPEESSFFSEFNHWFVSALGLSHKETKEQRQPTFASVPVWSSSLKREIPVGTCTGMKAVITTTTKEGVAIESEFSGKCYEPEEVDQVTWGFQGEPAGVKFTMANVPSAAMTNTVALSRILQVLDAPAGYVTSDELQGIPRYQHWA